MTDPTEAAADAIKRTERAAGITKMPPIGGLGDELASYTGEKGSSFKHGWSNTPTWKSWEAMHERCYDPRNASYKYYGARGISVCLRWNDFVSFLQDMGERPSLDHSIDRIDPDGDYCQANCRWLTRAEQYARRRDPGDNLEYDEQERRLNTRTSD